MSMTTMMTKPTMQCIVDGYTRGGLREKIFKTKASSRVEAIYQATGCILSPDKEEAFVYPSIAQEDDAFTYWLVIREIR